MRFSLYWYKNQYFLQSANLRRVSTSGILLVRRSFPWSMLRILQLLACMSFSEHHIELWWWISIFEETIASPKKIWKNEEISGKRFQRNQSDWPKKKERNESKVWVAFKKDFLKKLKYNNLTSQKEVFNCFVSRMRIFEVKVLKEFVKTLFFNVKL